MAILPAFIGAAVAAAWLIGDAITTRIRETRPRRKTKP